MNRRKFVFDTGKYGAGAAVALMGLSKRSPGSICISSPDNPCPPPPPPPPRPTMSLLYWQGWWGGAAAQTHFQQCTSRLNAMAPIIKRWIAGYRPTSSELSTYGSSLLTHAINSASSSTGPAYNIHSASAMYNAPSIAGPGVVYVVPTFTKVLAQLQSRGINPQQAPPVDSSFGGHPPSPAYNLVAASGEASLIQGIGRALANLKMPDCGTLDTATDVGIVLLTGSAVAVMFAPPPIDIGLAVVAGLAWADIMATQAIKASIDCP